MLSPDDKESLFDDFMDSKGNISDSTLESSKFKEAISKLTSPNQNIRLKKFHTLEEVIGVCETLAEHGSRKLAQGPRDPISVENKCNEHVSQLKEQYLEDLFLNTPAEGVIIWLTVVS
mmetsp:Transcript_24718/g.38484  ORF Transcript_24718/g.38484 Transcript_24718/m.38484 type:complete len:118 (+) Transcript_24718:220-573(+)|eukprot:CAMPEP_0170499270 /NCGR_PEP_ID=MMETSP0208-20121228/30814_1 /TAXON_ID=197538 /ORGANISM="Strombidium inclinatum, Strain S3" /LENGTH=117 /DNA_ID=CAMNT_0010776761 /DNA_START=129 /DNA_END=482 /DNA_ORIENTATION=-